MDELTGAEKKKLRGMAQRLEPAVMVGRHGLTAGVLSEIESALDRDQLVKIRFEVSRDALEQCAREIETATRAICVGSVGRTASFFRKPADPSDS